MAEFLGIKPDRINPKNSSNKRKSVAILPSFVLYLKDLDKNIFKIPLSTISTRLPYATNYPDKWIFSNLQLEPNTNISKILKEQNGDLYKFTITSQAFP